MHVNVNVNGGVAKTPLSSKRQWVMTTAHRPTFHAAVGGKEQGGSRYIVGVTRQHVHDLGSQLSIKRRAHGQGSEEEVRGKDLKTALEAREAEHLQAIGKAVPAKRAVRSLLPPPPPLYQDDDDDDDAGVLFIDPEDADDKPAPNTATAVAASASAADDDEDDDDDDDDGGDDDDDEEELMRELERIKKERAQEAARKEREAKEDAAAEHESAVLQGNPLLDPTRAGAPSTFAVKRRWDDDVVFKNQSREPKKEGRRFINDTVRNDFHRRFLNKYVK